MNEIIVGKKIEKEFGYKDEKVKVLDNVDITVYKGEFIAVMGPSGSGKTTLLFTLSGMDSVNKGEVIFEGQNIANLSESNLADLRRNRMGFIFQQPTMLRNLNLIDNIVIPAHHGNEKQGKLLQQRAKYLMRKVGIEGLEFRDITQVSGGQLQRAGICRAFISNPPVVFCDEPTGSLNSKMAQEVMDILLTFNSEGTTIILVTHDAKIASQADRVLFMKDGAIENELRFDKNSNYELRMTRVLEKMNDIEI